MVIVNDGKKQKVYSNYPPCLICKHLKKGFTCNAFNEGDIPNEIASGDNKHTKPMPDQGNDIVFEPIEDAKK